MSFSPLEKIETAINNWQPPEVSGDIPHGDMPGDKVEINSGHIAKVNAFFPALLPLVAETMKKSPCQRAVITVCGGSGVGKSESASLLTYYFRQLGVGSYTLSGDNYPRRIPKYNDAERERVFRVSGIRGMLDEGVYTEEIGAALRELQAKEIDADPTLAETYPWISVYQKYGRKGLAGYLGTENEQDFDELTGIVSKFKSGADKIWLKRMGRAETELWYDNVDFSEISILIIEWTHGNSDKYKGVDIPVLLNSTPAETREHRRLRNRDGKVDSAFTTMVLEIEQGLLENRAHAAKIIVSKSGELLTYDEYKKLMDEGR